MLEKKGRNFLRGGRKTYGEAIQNLLKSCLSYGPTKESRRILMKKKTKKTEETTE